MKFQCPVSKLHTAISKADKISGKNLSLEVLNFLILEVKGKTLTIKATNLDIGVIVSVPVKTEEEGLVAVPGNVISSFLSQISHEENVTITTETGNLHIATPHTNITIKTHPSDDFPNIPVMEASNAFEIDAEKLTQGLRSVWYSAAVSSMKPELASVFFAAEDGGLIFAATDSFRLAEKRVKAKHPHEFERVLIPAKNIPELIRVLEQGGTTQIMVEKSQLAFSVGDTYITTRLVDGVFPDYKQIIPTAFIAEATLLKEDVINAFKVANIFSDAFHQAKISLNIKDKTLTIETKNGDIGESKVSLEAALSGDSIEMHFNYKYIVDCFQSLNTDSVTIHFSGVGKPVVIKGVGDTSFLYLVMPMNK